MKTIWIFAGEASGDQYGARLADELRRQSADLQIRGMGGQAMRQAGVELMVDSSDLGVIGLVEVLKHILTFYRIFFGLLRRAREERPDAVVLIDYPGFNLRFAKRLRQLGIPVVYYVSPQVWAWGKGRIPEIARDVRKMLTIFPFEPAVYAGTGMDTEFVGHPMLEILGERRDPALTRDPNTVLLLPGSRTREIASLLPPMARTARTLCSRRANLRFVLPTPNERIARQCRVLLATLPEAVGLPLIVAVGETHRWMQRATAGLAASGTVTMESAILGLPLVVVYRVNALTYFIGRLLIKLPYFCIVNLVANRLVFAEYLQGDVRPSVLAPAVAAILPDGTRRADVEAGMAEAVASLGADTKGSARAATAILDLLAAPGTAQPASAPTSSRAAKLALFAFLALLLIGAVSLALIVRGNECQLAAFRQAPQETGIVTWEATTSIPQPRKYTLQVEICGAVNEDTTTETWDPRGGAYATFTAYSLGRPQGEVSHTTTNGGIQVVTCDTFEILAIAKGLGKTTFWQVGYDSAMAKIPFVVSIDSAGLIQLSDAGLVGEKNGCAQVSIQDTIRGRWTKECYINLEAEYYFLPNPTKHVGSDASLNWQYRRTVSLGEYHLKVIPVEQKSPIQSF